MNRFSTVLSLSAVLTTHAFAADQVVYVQSNNIEAGSNSIIAYELSNDGALVPLPGSPFLTGGTGIDNNTNGKLGPNDNDTPIIASPDGARLYAVNGHSDSIAVMDIQPDGTLVAVPGSPFASHGVHPVSLALYGDVLIVAHRNEDPGRPTELRGGASGGYTSFRIGEKGYLEVISTHVLADGGKPTQVLAPANGDGLVFGNDFQVDVDFDGDGSVSRLFGAEPRVTGGIHSFRLSDDGRLNHIEVVTLPETATPAPDVPSVPLGLAANPRCPVLYAGFVTRNELGVFRYDTAGTLSFVDAVPNSGQDICWLTTNRDGTRLYAVNNLPRTEFGDRSSTVTVFDISGEHAMAPVEMQRVGIPFPLGTFLNNRVSVQPNSTSFQLAIDQSEKFLFVLNQRINQTSENQSALGNMLHVLRIASDGRLTCIDARDLGADGVSPRARPQGVVIVEF